MTRKEATQRVKSMVERWDNTPCWHNPEFTNGRIHIDTGDLLAIKLVFSSLSDEGKTFVFQTLTV